MENISLSVCLAESCCNSNYLKRVLKKSSVVMYGRKYHWERGTSEHYYSLYCNHKCIGSLQYGIIRIESAGLLYCPNGSFLKALLAMFNLYPC